MVTVRDEMVLVSGQTLQQISKWIPKEGSRIVLASSSPSQVP